MGIECLWWDHLRMFGDCGNVWLDDLQICCWEVYGEIIVLGALIRYGI